MILSNVPLMRDLRSWFGGTEGPFGGSWTVIVLGDIPRFRDLRLLWFPNQGVTILNLGPYENIPWPSVQAWPASQTGFLLHSSIRGHNIAICFPSLYRSGERERERESKQINASRCKHKRQHTALNQNIYASKNIKHGYDCEHNIHEQVQRYIYIGVDRTIYSSADFNIKGISRVMHVHLNHKCKYKYQHVCKHIDRQMRLNA